MSMLRERRGVVVDIVRGNLDRGGPYVEVEGEVRGYTRRKDGEDEEDGKEARRDKVVERCLKIW